MNENDDEKTAVVIPWPHPRAPGAAATPASPTGPADGDAFDAAVRRALEAHEQAQPTAGEPDPRAAETLVAQVYSALSGADPDAALAAVRAQAATTGAPVIDLQAAREARQKATSEPNQRLGAALGETFNAFMKSLAKTEGKSEVVLDSSFFKEHGTTLLGNLFKGLASVLTQGVQPAPDERHSMSSGAPQQPSPTEREPLATGAEGPTGEKSEPAATAHEVRIRVDLGSLLAGLFRRRAPEPGPPPASPTTEASAPASSKPDET